MSVIRTCHECGISSTEPPEKLLAAGWSYRWAGEQQFAGMCSAECVTKFEAKARRGNGGAGLDSEFGMLSRNSITMGDSEAKLRMVVCQLASLLVQRSLTEPAEALQSLTSKVVRLVDQISDRQRFRGALTADDPVDALMAVAGTFTEPRINGFATAVAGAVAQLRDPSVQG